MICQFCHAEFTTSRPRKIAKFCDRRCAARHREAARQADFATRFWALVDRGDGCWPWLGTVAKNGYGEVKWNGRQWKAHRVSFALTYGFAPPVVRHFECRFRLCCRPEHLRGGTHQDNADDRESDGTTARGERSGAAKLTAAAVAEIRAEPGTYGYRGRLAARFGVSTALIDKVRQRAIWKHT
jgi:hypothetical protein